MVPPCSTLRELEEKLQQTADAGRTCIDETHKNHGGCAIWLDKYTTSILSAQHMSAGEECSGGARLHRDCLIQVCCVLLRRSMPSWDGTQLRSLRHKHCHSLWIPTGPCGHCCPSHRPAPCCMTAHQCQWCPRNLQAQTTVRPNERCKQGYMQ